MALISNKAGRTDSLDDMAEKVARASEKYPPLEELTPEQARAMREERGNPFAPAMVELHEVEDIRIEGERNPLRRGFIGRCRRMIPSPDWFTSMVAASCLAISSSTTRFAGNSPSTAAAW